MPALFGLLLVVLLVCTTPVGTGSGAHQFHLVHPLFAHVHVINGRIVTHEQMQVADTPVRQPSAGQGLGAAAGANAADADMGLIATDLPFGALDVPDGWDSASTEWQIRLPLDRKEAPPDPPPTSATSTT